METYTNIWGKLIFGASRYLCRTERTMPTERSQSHIVVRPKCTPTHQFQPKPPGWPTTGGGGRRRPHLPGRRPVASGEGVGEAPGQHTPLPKEAIQQEGQVRCQGLGEVQNKNWGGMEVVDEQNGKTKTKLRFTNKVSLRTTWGRRWTRYKYSPRNFRRNGFLSTPL